MNGSADLTGLELEVMDLTVSLMNKLQAIVGHGASRTGDLDELGRYLHGIQRMVLAQAAARRYPDKFRLLGETVSTHSGKDQHATNDH